MSIDQEMEEILQLFFEESFEGLDTMESGLLTLDNSANRETINTIFRAAHSIKGGSGTFGQVNLNATWQFNVAGAYQLPLGFTIAGNYFGRQGYPIAYYVIDSGTDGLSRRSYVTAVDTFRYGWVSQLDLRLEKNIPITATISATIGVDCFNVLNLNTVTQRNARLNQPSLSAGTQTVQETQAPRILRFSGRVSF